ncbi:MAG: ComEA family DNA-binding protein [Bdellovibrionota bacterium]
MRNLQSLILVLLLFWAISASAAVDLNNASKSELEALPGVGAAVAENIIAARPFRSVDDLKNVKGIGAARFAKMAPLVSVAAAEAPAQPAVSRAAPQARVSSAEPAQMSKSGRININSATLEEIESLPGIGPKKAAAIIQARPFNSPEDVMKVKGIKARTFAKIKDSITTN